MRALSIPSSVPFVLLSIALFGGVGAGRLSADASSFAEVVDEVQPRIVKIFGAGGFQGLEAYQSGFLISDDGYILTVSSYVLDTDHVTVVLDDGRRYQAEFLGADPRLEIALLKIDDLDLPYFDLSEAVQAELGARVLAFCNLYKVATGDEPASVLHGVVSARTDLSARRGAYQTPYSGPVYVLDAMTNNPGAPGGALTDRRGRLIGLLGKELRNTRTNTWLNFAIPIKELVSSVDEIREGRILPRADDDVVRPEHPLTTDDLGLVLVPDILRRTPPFIDRVRTNSPAERAGLMADDLLLFVEGKIVQSCTAVVEELALIHRDDPVRITVLRDQNLVEVTLGVNE